MLTPSLVVGYTAGLISSIDQVINYVYLGKRTKPVWIVDDVDVLIAI